MFLKIIEFHWQGLAGPVAAVAGLALLIAAGSIFVYLRSGREREAEGLGKEDSLRLKRLGVFGVLLIGVGLAGYAVLGGGQVLTERYEFAAPAQSEIGRIYYQPLAEDLNVPLREMIRKSGARVLKDPDRIEINRNAFIETPFVVLGKSGCVLEFAASGTEEKGERSRVLVGVLVLNESGTSLTGPYTVHDLTPGAKTYRIPMAAAAGKIAAVRIEFINATNKDRKPVRVVSVTNVVLKLE